MKNRFAKKKRDTGWFKDIALPVLVFAVVAGLFLFGVGGVGRTTQEERLRSVEKAVNRAAVQCYAVEGRYPPSLEYMEERYGLSIDYERYIVQYNPIGSNMMPTILVLPMDFAGSEPEDDWGVDE